MRNMSELAERYVFDYLPVFTQNLFVSMNCWPGSMLWPDVP